MSYWDIIFGTCAIVGITFVPFIVALLVEKGWPDFVQMLVDVCDALDPEGREKP